MFNTALPVVTPHVVVSIMLFVVEQVMQQNPAQM
jgi:hypothetical protein